MGLSWSWLYDRTTTYANSAYPRWSCEFESRSWPGLQLIMQSVPIITNSVSSNPAHAIARCIPYNMMQ